jgi:hypothetical protein
VVNHASAGLTLGGGNEGGEAFKFVMPIRALNPNAVAFHAVVTQHGSKPSLSRHADNVVAGHRSHSMTVTASQMIKPTGTPITPANSNNTNSNCRNVGGGIPPTGIR